MWAENSGHSCAGSWNAEGDGASHWWRKHIVSNIGCYHVSPTLSIDESHGELVLSRWDRLAVWRYRLREYYVTGTRNQCIIKHYECWYVPRSYLQLLLPHAYVWVGSGYENVRGKVYSGFDWANMSLLSCSAVYSRKTSTGSDCTVLMMVNRLGRQRGIVYRCTK